MHEIKEITKLEHLFNFPEEELKKVAHIELKDLLSLDFVSIWKIRLETIMNLAWYKPALLDKIVQQADPPLRKIWRQKIALSKKYYLWGEEYFRKRLMEDLGEEEGEKEYQRLILRSGEAGTTPSKNPSPAYFQEFDKNNSLVKKPIFRVVGDYSDINE